MEPRDVEPIIEILSESTFLDRGGQIDVRRRDDAYVDLERLVFSDAADLAVLNRAEEFRLEGERVSATSSKKNVPPSASSKSPFLAFTAPVNAPRA